MNDACGSEFGIGECWFGLLPLGGAMQSASEIAGGYEEEISMRVFFIIGSKNIRVGMIRRRKKIFATCLTELGCIYLD